jgi:peptide chain release factor subunit 3
MIGGAAQADVGVLVISARQNEFEAGFERGGQTREHAMLAKTLGIQRLIVLVNKMDEQTVKWSQQRYDDIEKKLTPFLKKWGYNTKTDVIYCPCSGYTGANMKVPVGEAAPWYKGPPFLEILDKLKPVERDPNQPVRIPIIARYKEMRAIRKWARSMSSERYGHDTALAPPQSVSRRLIACPPLPSLLRYSWSPALCTKVSVC